MNARDWSELIAFGALVVMEHSDRKRRARIAERLLKTFELERRVDKLEKSAEKTRKQRHGTS